jgi:LysM repeat protein
MSVKEQNEAQVTEFKGFISASNPAVNDKGVIVIGEEPFNKAKESAGVTDDELKKVRQFSTNYVAAAHEVGGKMAVDHMAKNKDLASVNVNIDLGAFGHAGSKVNRSHTGTVPGTDKEVITYGTNTAKITIIAGQNSSGVNAASAAIKEYAKATLGK